MQPIYQSASKIAFLLLMATACAGFLLRLLEAKDFMQVVMAAAVFYFAHKGDPTQSNGGK